MLLRRQRLFIRHFSGRAERQRTTDAAGERQADDGTEHRCGLRHRFSCESWSWTAAMMWWALRNDR